jgi:hypothetical protein
MNLLVTQQTGIYSYKKTNTHPSKWKDKLHTGKPNAQDKHHQIFLSRIYAILSQVCIDLIKI